MSVIRLGVLGSEVVVPKAGRSFVEGDVELIRESRTASGRYVEDQIARKKLFTISYDKIKGADLDTLVGLYNLNQFLNFIVTDRSGATRNYTVKMRPFQRHRWRVLDGWIWRDVSFELEEI